MSKKEEKSQLLEQVEGVKENQEEVKEFDVNAFTEEIIEKKEDNKSDTKEEVEDNELDSEGSDWAGIEIDEIETDEEETEVKDEDWDTEEEDSNEEETVSETTEPNNEIDWSTVSNELGLEAGSKEDLISNINEIINKNKSAQPQTKSESITMLNSLLSLGDRELLAEEMKADDMDEYDIDESLDKMEDSGVLKREVVRIRRQLKNALKNEKQNIKSSTEQKETDRVNALSQNKKDLQKHLKNIDSYFGGKINKTEKKNLYKYITSGKFNDDIYDSHENVAEVAWMWRNKEKIKKILFSEGFEKGKAHVFNGITSPSTNRSSKPNLKITSGKFDPSEFIKE